MTLPASGPLTLSDIQTEFGGTNPIGMNEYYAGGGLVPAGTSGTYGTVPSSGALSVQNFYGTSAVIPAYIEDVFSTWLYTGNGSTKTITNGIDLSTKSGMVWIKNRSSGYNNALFDTTRGATKQLVSNSNAAQTTDVSTLTSFNNNGFSLGYVSGVNESNTNLVSWTFQKKAKFFDIVTGTQTAAGNVTLNHNLGSVPGCIIVKNTSGGPNNWNVYHQSLGVSQYLILEGNDAASSGYAAWGGVAPTSTQFTIGYQYPVGTQFVAYLFASNAGGFGLTGTDNVITCGSYVGNGVTTGPTVTLGYEPQLLIVKKASDTADWLIYDNMRNSGSWGTRLNPNLPNAENSNIYAQFEITATGFYSNSANNSSNSSTNTSGATYIYIAIRRGPMKVPTSGTSVFTPIYATASAGTTRTVGFTADLLMARNANSGDQNWMTDRLRGFPNGDNSTPSLYTTGTAAEISAANYAYNVWNTTAVDGYATAGVPNIWAYFGRAPSFFDAVCYTGTGVSVNQVVKHNLTVQPELLIVKVRSTTGNWYVNAGVLNPSEQYAFLNLTNAFDFNGPFAGSTATEFYATSSTNTSGQTFVAYLFATCAGVSKVGSYTGTGALQTVNCGFTSGARFVMIKRTDSTGNWWFYDSARGITGGNDPYLFLNSTNAQVTGYNYVDTTSVGFQVTAAAPANLNDPGGKYLFLAIA